MASTLTYLFELPATGDRGSVFWPILEDNITKTNDHTHNGTNSAKLSAAAVDAVVQTVTSAGWTLIADGLYRQTVTIPVGITSLSGTYDTVGIELRDSTTGRKLLLPTEKLSSSTFYVWTNDNTQGIKVFYT